MDINNIPSVEDKIYELFIDLLSLESFDKEEVKKIIDEALAFNNTTMDELMLRIIEGVDDGISMEEQFSILKKMLK